MSHRYVDLNDGQDHGDTKESGEKEHGENDEHGEKDEQDGQDRKVVHFPFTPDMPDIMPDIRHRPFMISSETSTRRDPKWDYLMTVRQRRRLR